MRTRGHDAVLTVERLPTTVDDALVGEILYDQESETYYGGVRDGAGEPALLDLGASGGGGGETDPEIVRDTMASTLVAGANVTIIPNDAANTITIAATDTDTNTTDPEIIRDTMAATLVAGANVTITPDDALETITIASSYVDTNTTDPEVVRDTMATALVAGTNITLTPSDPADTITIAAAGGASTLPALTDVADTPGSAYQGLVTNGTIYTPSYEPAFVGMIELDNRVEPLPGWLFGTTTTAAMGAGTIYGNRFRVTRPFTVTGIQFCWGATAAGLFGAGLYTSSDLVNFTRVANTTPALATINVVNTFNLGTAYKVVPGVDYWMMFGSDNATNTLLRVPTTGPAVFASLMTCGKGGAYSSGVPPSFVSPTAVTSTMWYALVGSVG